MIEGGQACGGSGAQGDHDLLVWLGGAIASGDDAWHVGTPMVIDDDLATIRQLNNTLEPFGVRQQTDLDEDAGNINRLVGIGAEVEVLQPADLRAVTDDLVGGSSRDDIDICLLYTSPSPRDA